MKHEYEKALLDYKEKRFNDALLTLRDLAARNHPPSKWLLGRMYASGEGIEKNPKRAAELLTEAGSAGFTFAQVQLAWLFIDTLGQPELGIKTLKAAADDGYPIAQNDLGQLFYAGDIVPADPELAIKYLTDAAENAEINAQLTLGRIYSTSDFISANFTKSLYFNTLAAEAGEPKGYFNVAGLFLEGQGVDQNLEKGVEWLQKAANAGLNQARVNLGAIYADKILGQPDYEKSLFWYTQAAKDNDPIAQLNLGLINFHGQGIEKEPQIALMWMFLAYDNGNENAKDYIEELAELVSDEEYEKAKCLALEAYESDYDNF